MLILLIIPGTTPGLQLSCSRSSLFWASHHSVAAEILLDMVTLRLSSQCSLTHSSHKIEWEIREINHNYYPVSFVPMAIVNAVPFAWKAHLSELHLWQAHHVGHSLNVTTCSHATTLAPPTPLLAMSALGLSLQSPYCKFSSSLSVSFPLSFLWLLSLSPTRS